MIATIMEIRENNENVLQKSATHQEVPQNVDTRLPEELLGFHNKIIRQAFIRKVFLVMTAQFALTSVIVAPLILIESSRKILIADRGIFLGAVLIFWLLYSLIICSYGLSKTWPQNYIMLTLLTVSLAIVIACTCALLDFKDILIGILCTATLCFTLGTLASISSFDFTIFTSSLSSFLFALLVLILLYFLVPSKLIIWIILSLGMTILILYFIIDVQIIVQGKHRYVLTPADHIATATLLYVDIIYIFIFVLMILLRKS